MENERVDDALDLYAGRDNKKQVMTTKCVKVKDRMRRGFQKLKNCEDDKSDDRDENDKILPARITYLTPALIEEARTQLNETPEGKQKALADLRKMIEAEQNLVTPTDDLFLLAFLRARKFKVKRAFKLLQNYWSFRKEYRKIYDTLDVEWIRTTIDTIRRNFMGFLPFRDRNGCLVVVLKIGQWDTEKDSYENLFLAISGILVYSLEHEATQVAGYRIIFDLRGFNWTHVKHLTPSNVLLLIRSTQFCFPGRYKAIHVLSENKALNFVWALAYPFLTQKLKKRIFFHGEDLAPLSQFIHPSVLPVEFGGQGPTFNNDEWEEIIRSRAEHMSNHNKCGYQD